MAIIRSRVVETGRNMDAYEPYCVVFGTFLIKMHAAPGNRDLLHFLASVGRKFLHAHGLHPSRPGWGGEKVAHWHREMGSGLKYDPHTL